MVPLTITIQTFSDTLCPWSYIGKKNLDLAIDLYRGKHPDVEFEVTWNPFYLHPKAKVSGYEKKEFYVAKFGPADAPAFFARVEDEAAALGLALSWEGRCGSTRDSHVLLLLAARQQQQRRRRRRQQEFELDLELGKGRGAETGEEKEKGRQQQGQCLLRDLSGAFFRGAFEQGRDISDRAFLVEEALRAGLEVGAGAGDRSDDDGEGADDAGREEALLRWLDNEEASAEADALDRHAKQEVGITATPSYVVQGRYSVGGKQSPEVFLRLFERIRSEGRC